MFLFLKHFRVDCRHHDISLWSSSLCNSLTNPLWYIMKLTRNPLYQLIMTSWLSLNIPHGRSNRCLCTELWCHGSFGLDLSFCLSHLASLSCFFGDDLDMFKTVDALLSWRMTHTLCLPYGFSLCAFYFSRLF